MSESSDDEEQPNVGDFGDIGNVLGSFMGKFLNWQKLITPD